MKNFTSISLFALGIPLILLGGQEKAETNLDDIVITANAKNQSDLTMAPASVTLINIEDANKKRVLRDIGDALVGVPGVSVTSNPNGSRSVNMRGLSHGYSLVLTDSKRSYSGEALWRGDDNVLSSTPTIAIDRFEVVRGPMSSLYGADAMGGVVNVITRRHKGEAEGSISLETQYNQSDEGGNGQQYGVYYSTPINEKISWTTYGNLLDMKESFYKDAADRTKLRANKNYNFFNELAIDITDNQELDISLQLSSEKKSAKSLYRGRADKEERKRKKVQADYKVNFANSIYNANIIYDIFDNDELKEKTLDFDNRVVYNLFDDTFITTGFSAKKSKLSGYPTTNDEISRNAYALYLEGDTEIADGLIMTLGGRLDKDDDFGSEATYRAYLAKNFYNGFVLKGGLGTAYKAPKMLQTFSDYSAGGCGGRCTVYGNDLLQPETGYFKEIGISYNDENIYTSLTIFDNKIEDIINYKNVGNTRDLIFDNVDRVDIRGAELTFNQKFKNIETGLNYTYLDTKNNETDKELYGVAKHEIDLNLNFTYNAELEFLVNAHYRSGHLGELGRYVKLPGYTITNIGGLYKINSDAKVKFGVNNITNRDISQPDVYSEIIRGRTLYAGIEYSF